jgi:hypothetical protein
MEVPAKIILALLFLSSAATSALFAQAKAPAVYVDKGACPFECCTYRAWRTEKNTVAYASLTKVQSVWECSKPEPGWSG